MPLQKTTRKEILARCWEVIHLNGYRSSSISLLAKAAGLGKAGLLHHFGSKEGLMHAVIDFAYEEFRRYVFSVAQEDLPLDQRLEKSLRRQNRLAKLNQRGCFFTNMIMEVGQEGTFNARLMDFYDEWTEHISGLFAEIMPEKIAREQAYLTLINYEGAIAMYKLTGDEAHLERFVKRAIAPLKETKHVA